MCAGMRVRALRLQARLCPRFVAKLREFFTTEGTEEHRGKLQVYPGSSVPPVVKILFAATNSRNFPE